MSINHDMSASYDENSRENRCARKIIRKFETESWKKSLQEQNLEVLGHAEAGDGDTLHSNIVIQMKADGQCYRVTCVQKAHANGTVEALYGIELPEGDEIEKPGYMADLVDWLLSYGK